LQKNIYWQKSKPEFRLLQKQTNASGFVSVASLITPGIDLSNPRFGQKVFGQKVFGQKVFGKKVFGKKVFGQKDFGQKVFGQ
jgi:hypothetical protein